MNRLLHRNDLVPAAPLAGLAGLSLACLLIAGCGSGGNVTTTVVTTPPVTTYSGVSFSGNVMAASQPIVAASVQLFAAGTTGDGSAPTSLLTASLTTDSNGAFTVPAGYQCPTGASQLYVVSRGGSVGSGSANSVIALLASLGACNQVAASSHIIINEVTTVANVWALSQFLATGGKIGASATNTVGIANAVATAASLYSSAGAANPATGAAPAPRINTFANLLHSCVASSASSSACTNLLSSSADTLDSAVRIVHNPATNVAALYSQAGTTTAFTPALSRAPADFTLFLNFTGAGMNYPSGVGVDSQGNVWVANYYFVASKFSPLGVPAFPSGITGYGLNNSYGLAIDSNDNVWIPNQESSGSVNSGLGSVTVLNSSGQPVSGANGYTAGGLDYPTALAVDTDNSVWVVDYGNSHITHLSNAGAPLSGAAGYTANSFAFPDSIAVDGSHNAWIGDQNDTFINRVSATGSVTPVNCCDGPNGLAVDQSGNIWAANYYGNSISEVSNSGTVLANGAFTANATTLHPQGIAIDGAGNVWIANFRAPYLTELAGANSTTPATGQPISPAAGWAPDSPLFTAYALAIDSSGNIWVTNLTANSLTEFVGLAAPIKTPQIGPPQLP